MDAENLPFFSSNILFAPSIIDRAKQLHKRFPNEQVESLVQRYNDREIKLHYILDSSLTVAKYKLFK
jgi:hypothetical protein